MTYTVEILPVAARAIRKLPPEAKRRVQAMIELLEDDPRPPAAKKLTALHEWRVRTSDYRVLYRIEGAVLMVIIVDAGHPASSPGRDSSLVACGDGGADPSTANADSVLNRNGIRDIANTASAPLGAGG